MINKKLNTQRAQKIIFDIQILEKQLEHYRKISNRWKITGKAVRIVNITLTSLIAGTLCVLGTLMTQGIIIAPLAMGLLGGYSTLETALLEVMNIGVIKKKKHKFSEKVNLIQDYINKMYFYFEKARSDGIITLDELENFQKIRDEFNNKINNNIIIILFIIII